MTSDPGVCEICGKELAGDHAECRKREAEWHAERRRQDDQLVAQFKLKRVTAENRDAFHRAVQAVSRAVDQAGIAVDESGAFEADHWWFVPYGWIGCAGHIVEKDSETVNMLGSVWPLSLCFWGQERGALRTPCTLVVERVHDRASTHQLLQKLDNRSPFNPVPIQGRTEDGELRWLDADEVLADLPFRVHTKSLWFALPALKEAEDTGAFEFRVE